MKIRSYDGDAYSYSGTDEEYAEFLNSIDGNMNEGEPVEDCDLGATKKINLQGVIEKFRKTAGGIKDASKKITAEAVNKIEDLKKNRENITPEPASNDYSEAFSEYAEETAPPVTGDEAIENSFDDREIKAVLKSLCAKTETLATAAENLKDRADTLEINLRDSSATIEELKHKTVGIGEGVEEIRKAVSGINKLHDSIFDLKNAQLNSKNSLEEFEKSFISLKKKSIWGVTIVSILTIISIAIEIIILLS